MDNDKDITIVSAFFSLKKNKYNSLDIYKFWGTNLLPNLNKNLVIFTDEENYEFISTLRNGMMDKTKIIKTKLEDFYMYKYIDYLNKDFERDHENSYHNTGLYLIWNEKINFVKKAIELNFFNTSYYAWCDFGCVRNSIYTKIYLKNFPNISKITEDKIYICKADCDIQPTDFNNPFDEKFRYSSGSFVGSFFVAKKELMLIMYDIFYNQIIPEYIKRDLFIGKDQTLYISLYLLYPKLFKIITGENDEYTIPNSQLKWFYFLKYFS